MDVDQVVEIGRGAVLQTLLLAAPLMLVAIAVGLVISILQAVTQLQDQTLSFVPKIISLMLALLYVLPWLIVQIVEYADTLVRNIPHTL